MLRRAHHVRISNLNPHLLCVLCGGYYVDATTIIECLHSFCKTCIVRYLESSKYCPICDVQVHKTKPLLNIRPDRTLQELVYKLVPGLFTREVLKRRDFYRKNDVSEDSVTEDEDGGMSSLACAAKALSPGVSTAVGEDTISISLDFSADGNPAPKAKRRKSSSSTNQDTILQKRYLLCPASFTIGHLKKFVRMKLDIAPNLQVDVFHLDEPLSDSYALMDIAFIYNWYKNSPFPLYFSVFKSPQKVAPWFEMVDIKHDDDTKEAAPVPFDESSNKTTTAITQMETSSEDPQPTIPQTPKQKTSPGKQPTKRKPPERDESKNKSKVTKTSPKKTQPSEKSSESTSTKECATQATKETPAKVTVKRKSRSTDDSSEPKHKSAKGSSSQLSEDSKKEESPPKIEKNTSSKSSDISTGLEKDEQSGSRKQDKKQTVVGNADSQKESTNMPSDSVVCDSKTNGCKISTSSSGKSIVVSIPKHLLEQSEKEKKKKAKKKDHHHKHHRKHRHQSRDEREDKNNKTPNRQFSEESVKAGSWSSASGSPLSEREFDDESLTNKKTKSNPGFHGTDYHKRKNTDGESQSQGSKSTGATTIDLDAHKSISLQQRKPVLEQLQQEWKESQERNSDKVQVKVTTPKKPSDTLIKQNNTSPKSDVKTVTKKPSGNASNRTTFENKADSLNSVVAKLKHKTAPLTVRTTIPKPLKPALSEMKEAQKNKTFISTKSSSKFLNRSLSERPTHPPLPVKPHPRILPVIERQESMPWKSLSSLAEAGRKIQESADTALGRTSPPKSRPTGIPWVDERQRSKSVTPNGSSSLSKSKDTVSEKSSSNLSDTFGPPTLPKGIKTYSKKDKATYNKHQGVFNQSSHTYESAFKTFLADDPNSPAKKARFAASEGSSNSHSSPKYLASPKKEKVPISPQPGMSRPLHGHKVIGQLQLVYETIQKPSYSEVCRKSPKPPSPLKPGPVLSDKDASGEKATSSGSVLTTPTKHQQTDAHLHTENNVSDLSKKGAIEGTINSENKAHYSASHKKSVGGSVNNSDGRPKLPGGQDKKAPPSSQASCDSSFSAAHLTTASSPPRPTLNVCGASSPSEGTTQCSIPSPLAGSPRHSNGSSCTLTSQSTDSRPRSCLLNCHPSSTCLPGGGGSSPQNNNLSAAASVEVVSHCHHCQSASLPTASDATGYSKGIPQEAPLNLHKPRCPLEAESKG